MSQVGGDRASLLGKRSSVVLEVERARGECDWWRPTEHSRWIAEGSKKRVKTEPRYSEAIDRFMNWAWEHRITMESRDDADFAGYLFVETVRELGWPKSWGLVLESAVKYYDPVARQEGLPWIREGIKSLQADTVTESHMPVLFPMALTIASEQRRLGDVEGSLMTIVLHAGWLRPGEGTALIDEDVHLPEEPTLMRGGGGALIRVAPSGRPAKVGRPQPAQVDPGIGLVALRALKRRARKYGRKELMPGGYLAYAQSFRNGHRRTPISHLRLTPHGLRAAACTESKHREELSQKRQERGRWASKAAMRVYQDQVAAQAASLSLPGHVSARLKYVVDHVMEFLPELSEGLLREESSEEQLRTVMPRKTEQVLGVRKRVAPKDVVPAWW